MGLLVLLSLVLITVSFRSSALDGVQGTAAGDPEAVRGRRRPRLAALPRRRQLGARAGRRQVREQAAEVARSRRCAQQLSLDEGAVQENVQLKASVELSRPAVDRGLRPGARVGARRTRRTRSTRASRSPPARTTAFARADVVIDAVSGGLVGTVDRAFAERRARHAAHRHAERRHCDRPDEPDGGRDRSSRAAAAATCSCSTACRRRRTSHVGDTIITAGSLGKGALPSMFPRGIPIGTVVERRAATTSTRSRTIQVKPFVDFSSLQSVIVLVPKSR